MRKGCSFLPVIAFVGPSRCGKDTAAEWFDNHTFLRYKGGCSWTMREHIAAKLDISVEEAWATRHERKMEWKKLCDEYRRHDPARIIKGCLLHSDVVAGIRDFGELRHALLHDLIDLVIWIDRDVPPDPTLTFGPEEAHVIISNRGNRIDFRYRLIHLARSLGVLREEFSYCTLGEAADLSSGKGSG